MLFLKLVFWSWMTFSLLSKMSLNLNPPEFVHFVAYIIALATKVLYLPI